MKKHKKHLSLNECKQIKLQDGFSVVHAFIKKTDNETRDETEETDTENKKDHWNVYISTKEPFHFDDHPHQFKWPVRILKNWDTMTFVQIEKIFHVNNPAIDCDCATSGATIPSFLCFLSSVSSMSDIPDSLDLEGYHHRLDSNSRQIKKRSPRDR